MRDTPLFQGFDDNKKQALTKASIRASLLAQSKSHMALGAILGVIFSPFAAIAINGLVRNFNIQMLIISTLLGMLIGGYVCLFVVAAREYAALRRDAFTVKEDTLVEIKKRTKISGKHVHEENLFRFESGLRFSQTLTTSTQPDLACCANRGYVFYLVLLDYKPTKPRYVYNTKYYEYTE
jgi:hypothetical protein